MPASSKVMDEAFVTLATTDSYALGALVLSSSLRRIETNRQLVVMVTPGVSQTMRDQLLYAFDAVVNVDVLDSRDAVNLDILGRPDLGLTFTKLHCWRLTQYSKCVFMDADTLVLKNVDDLFDREEFSAAPDVGWPDCFNSGVFVFRPSEETYQKLLQFALTCRSFDGGDQGLLNQFFSDWATKDIAKHLPFVYNVVGHSFYSYLPAFFQFGQATKVAHFIGATKPWHLGYNRAYKNVESGDMSHLADFVHIWWRIFMEDVHHRLLGDLPSLVNVYEHYYAAPPPPADNPAPLPLPPAEPINYQMTAPYVPPDIPVYYEPPVEQPSVQRHHPEYVEPADSRPYSHLEAFYSEPPMTHTEGYTRPDVAYQARDVCQSWTEFAHSSPAAEQEPATQPSPALPTVAEEPEQLPEEAVCVASEPVPNLETFTKDKIQDHQHQMNWEHGQIDYLGVDSFDNILAKINAVITTPSEPPASPRRSASEGSVQPLKTARKGKMATAQLPASCHDSAPDIARDEVIEAAPVVRPLESGVPAASTGGAIESVDLGRVIAGEVPEAQLEREEMIVRRPAGRKQEQITDTEVELQQPGIDRLLATVVASKPGTVSPRKVKAVEVVTPPVDRIERVIRIGGRRQEIISTNEFNDLVNGSAASNGSASPSKSLPEKLVSSISDLSKEKSSVKLSASSTTSSGSQV